jgi:hypothetical protein
MVKLYTSLLAITLATGSALASSSDYERRSDIQAPISHLRFGLACARHDNLQSRGFEDEEDLFVRDDAFDDLEAREPGKFGALSSAFKIGKKIAGHKNTKNAFRALDYSQQAYGAVQQFRQLRSRGFEDDEDIFVRDLDAEELVGRDDLLDQRDIIDDLD